MEATAKIEGKNLVITLPMADPPQPSKSGKGLVVASTRGNMKTTLMIQGKPVVIGVNAYITR